MTDPWLAIAALTYFLAIAAGVVILVRWAINVSERRRVPPTHYRDIQRHLAKTQTYDLDKIEPHNHAMTESVLRDWRNDDKQENENA